MSDSTKIVAVRLPIKLARDLKTEAALRDTTITDLVREAVEAKLQRTPEAVPA